MLLKKFLAFLLSASLFSAQASASDIFLTESEAAAIRRELLRMSEATTRLRGELDAQRERSRKLLETSRTLQERLDSALATLEESERSLEISRTELSELLTLLAELRTDYAALWESWTARKNEARKWKRIAAAGWISAGAAAAGGVLWAVLR